MNANFLIGFSSFLALLVPWTSARRPVAAEAASPPAGTNRFEGLRFSIEVDLPVVEREGRTWMPPLAEFRTFDAELVLRAEAECGFESLSVLDDQRRPVIALAMPSGECGLSQIEIETASMPLGDLLRAYPRGRYFVQAVTTGGETIEGTVVLRSRFPGFFSVSTPLPNATVPFDDVTIAWTPASDAARYTIEIEQDAIGFSCRVELPPEQTSFTVPAALLQPNQPYDYSLVVQGDTDNELEIEGRFMTGPATR